MATLIKTKAAHEQAIRRISELMDASPAPGTIEAEELELLAHLAEDYEKKKFDIGLPDPITAIRFCMEQQRLTRADLVPYLGTKSRVSEILGGKRPLTVPMIRKLHQGLGIPAEVLVGAEAERGLPVEAVERFPFNEMFKRGYFQFSGPLREAKKQGGRLMNEFACFGLTPDAVSGLNRQSVRKGSTEDPYALLAWNTRVLCRAKEMKFSKAFAPAALDAAACKHLVSLSTHDDGPVLAVEYLATLGVPVIIEPHLPKTHLDGAAMRLPDTDRPVIALTLRYDRIDSFWFCLLHELGHVIRHIIPGAADIILDNFSEESSTVREKEADEFALNCAVAKEEWQRLWKCGGFTAETVRHEAKRLMIHPAILAGRIRKEMDNYVMLNVLMGNGTVRARFPKEFASVKPTRVRPKLPRQRLAAHVQRSRPAKP